MQVRPREWTEIGPEIDRGKIIEELKKTKNTAPGADGIFYTHLKNLPTSGLDYLAAVYQESMTCCYFPTTWRKGRTSLIPKPGKDPSSVVNYRPITLLDALGKLFERLINSKLTKFLEEKRLLPESQAGFRKARSTQDQLFKLAQDATTSINNGQVTVASFFDVEKAYDKVWREGLALKMAKSEIPETMVALLIDFISERTIQLKVGNLLSDPVHLHCGLAQGSILAPGLHNYWVSDVPQPPDTPSDHDRPEIRLSQFADDIGTWVNAKNVKTAREKLQAFNDSIVEWCSRWKIRLSSAKTQVIGFGQSKSLQKEDIYQTIEGKVVTHQDQATFLGIIFDSNMNWRSHSTMIKTRLKQRIGMFAGITGSVNHPRASNEISLAILKSMIEPIMYYAPSVLCARTAKFFDKQDQLIAQGARLALHVPKTIGRPYVQNRAGIIQSKTRTLQLAKKYLSDDKRSCSVKETFQNSIRNIPTRRTRVKTPGYLISCLE